MTELHDILTNIRITTSKLKPEMIQKVIAQAKRSDKSVELNPIWDEVTAVLLKHLQIGLHNFDDQLLCATCFYTALALSNTCVQDDILNKILVVINEEFQEKDKKNNDQTTQAVCLMYGLFQSSFLIKLKEDNVTLKHLLQVIFDLLSKMANEYSRFTFLVFKTINAFKKVCGTQYQDLIYSRTNQIILLHLINNNWENPITGVRDLNKEIFSTILEILDKDLYTKLFEEINSFYWSKAKYLMLAEIIDQCKIDVYTLLSNNSNWLDGLSYSLQKPGLVSAGTDMYHAIFKKISTVDEWSTIFLEFVTTIMCGSFEKAIENFNNYWWLTTIKRFPSLFEVVIKELDKLPDSEHIRFSKLFICKQANRQGIVSDYLSNNGIFEDLVFNNLLHCNSYMRMLAFDLMCVSQTKTMPTKHKYNLVLSFLHDNINSDCTVLRQNMLKSCNNFLIQLNMKSSKNMKMDSNEQNLQDFTVKMQEFLIETLAIGGNYQRKITCVKLIKLFLTSLNEIPQKKQKQIRQCNKSIIETLRQRNILILMNRENTIKILQLLNDPAEDIRENVVELLLNQYSYELRDASLFEYLVENALLNMRSKFFYQIGCGQSMFKLIINLLIKEKYQEARFKNVEEVFAFAHKELVSEHKLQRDIVDSIEIGKQLYSFITILQTGLEVCFQKDYALKIEPTDMRDLLITLESVSFQFSWEQNGSKSSDFSKMSDMVESFIHKSITTTVSDKDDTKISGLHQIVLNCLWLNVKTSCELSSLLIQYKNETCDQLQVSQQCLCIIIHVLESCRHKGAIEAAGVALGQSIRYLTSLPEHSSLSKLPNDLLRKKLDELISEASKMASVTRRGAGLSIMVHRIVSSDMKKGKPLFHYFMSRLLEACGQAEDVPADFDAGDIDNEKDLPKAIYIHFFTRIVTDSSLSSDVMYYAAELAELAFCNITNSLWQIRNAALQLYGALIPKLIGQKKASGACEETIATVACDELRTHFLKLWNYMLSKLEVSENTAFDKLQHDSNLVPILNILANIARRYNFTVDDTKLRKSEELLLINLFLRLDSPIHTVRRLTAKSICNIFTFEVIYKTLVDKRISSENYLHGCLILTYNCYKLYYANAYKNHFENLKMMYCEILNSKTHSYLCRELYEKIFFNSDFCNGIIEETFLEVEGNVHLLGISSWANNRVSKYLEDVPKEMIPKLLKCILAHKDFEHYCKELLVKIENDKSITTEVKLEVAKISLTSKYKFERNIIWKILFEVSLSTNLENYVTEDILRYLEECTVTYGLRHILPFVGRVAVLKKNEKCLTNISSIVLSLISSNNTDVEMRLIATMTINEISVTFIELPVNAKINIIKSVVLLLQDEDEDVRNLSVQFYVILSNEASTPHPYACLQKLLKSNFIKTILDINSINDLCNELDALLANMSLTNNIDEYNPFANDSKNMYLEVVILKRLIENLRIGLE